uniref:Polymorphic mucin variant C7/2/25r2.5 n=1 Tax=Schistosoma mansoni TaxID=6183 RepID=B3V485_SCHMA|nr:polymorphic mucin variant C7/2/25r2.5 [Schistosoma mansoni]
MNKKIILSTIIYIALMIRGDLASDKPTGDLASDKPTGDLASDKPTGDLASDKPTGDLASDKPTGDLASDKPTGDLASDKPTGDLASDKPTGDLASDKPTGDLASDKPTGDLASDKPTGDLASDKPTGDLASDKPTGDLASDKPTGDLASDKPTGDLASDKPTGDLASDKPTGDLASDKPTGDLASDKPTGDLASDKPTGDLASDKPTGDLASDKPTGDLASDKPTGDLASDKPTGDLASDKPTVPKHLKTRINDYKYAYYKSSIQKFLSLEPYTRARSTTAPHIYHEECLRLEKLYFTKWAVHYLSKNAATDITLLQSYENEYEEAKKGDKNADRRRDWSGLLRVRISEKWKKRELLDDVESAYIAETRTKVNVNKEKLKKQLTNTENKIEAQLNIVKELESKAIQATNEHMDNRDDKSLKEQYYEAYSTLAKELRSLVGLMGEAEFQRILLLTTLPKDEQINMIIQAMDKDSTNCS